MWRAACCGGHATAALLKARPRTACGKHSFLGAQGSVYDCAAAAGMRPARVPESGAAKHCPLLAGHWLRSACGCPWGVLTAQQSMWQRSGHRQRQQWWRNK